MPLNDRERRVLAAIARDAQADDPVFAAALTDPRRRPQPVWGPPVLLRVLAFLLIGVGVLTSVELLIPAALAVFGIAQLSWVPSPPPSTTAGGDDQPESSHDS